MPMCLRCNWVLNSPINGAKLSSLLNGIMQWLHYRGFKQGSKAKHKVLSMIDSYKVLNNDTNESLALCRHCLMESVYLLVPRRLKQEFKKTFIDVYDFNSVIY